MRHHETLFLITAALTSSCTMPAPHSVFEHMPTDAGTEMQSASSERVHTSLAHLPDGGSLEAPRCGYQASDRVLDGDFESHPVSACGWYVFDATPWGVMTTPYCALGDHDGCVMYLASGGHANDTVAQFSQEPILEPSTRYVLSFETRVVGEAPKPFVVSVLNTEPNDGLGDGVHMEAGTTWHEYAFSFRTTERPGNVLLDFSFGNVDTGFYLDNVSINSAASREAPH